MIFRRPVNAVGAGRHTPRAALLRSRLSAAPRICERID